MRSDWLWLEALWTGENDVKTVMWTWNFGHVFSEMKTEFIVWESTSVDMAQISFYFPKIAMAQPTNS